VLFGANGAGKTSLLEAVYLASTTRSFRAPDLAACARHGSGGFHVAIEAGEGASTRLELGWQPGRRLRLAGGVELPLAEHVALQPLVLWSAAEAELRGGAPQHGRRLIERALHALGRFRQVLEQKRQLLARGGGGDGAEAALSTWNAMLAEASAELIALRAGYVAGLGRALDRVRDRTPLPLPALTVEYLASPRTGVEGRAAILAALERVAGRERERRQPLLGPHRDGLRLLWAGREAKTVASAGEAEVFGLLLAAAQGELVREWGREPLYLLDDADAELDRGRLAAAWSAFADAAQLLATTSRPEAWEGLPHEAGWRVEDGRARPR
jgi:DNA replication and repair protein RecF